MFSPALIGDRAAWSFPFSSLDLDFQRGRATLRGRQLALTSAIAVSNASGGYVQWSDGHLTSIGANLPRISDLGLLIEQGSTNLALHSNDFTNASWTKTTMTAALDQVGPDNVANSASSLLATGTNATALQSVTHASSADVASFWIKRITGTGTISITLDGGSTYTDVTSQINSSGYTLVQKTQTVTNPSLGIKLGTNTDKIAVWCGQLEVGAFATSPIVTTTTSVARNADSVTLTSTAQGAFSTTFPLSAYVKASSSAVTTGASATLFAWSDGTNNNRERMLYGTSNNVGAETAVSGTPNTATTANTAAQGATFAAACTLNTNDGAVALNGGTVGAQATMAQPSGLNTFQLGQLNGSGFLNSYLKRLALFSGQRLANGVLQQVSAN